ncbi:insulinase family protein [Alteromonas sp. 14N.309.X.WAT.G.H12]|uniref:insulinase family protein n=1 Tax=Alteromonas sp. 14N.309.X.WAT.G.H12 TaxID=3120824 RepID=UPI002FD53815
MYTSDNGTTILHDTQCTDSYGAVFVINTPVYDYTGIAHVAEHLIFRTSPSFPSPHNLFATLALSPLSINASTQGDITMVFAQMPVTAGSPSRFLEAIAFLYAGIINQQYTDNEIKQEKDGVIYQELRFYERQRPYTHAIEKWIDNPDLYSNSEVATLCAGGFSRPLMALCANDILAYKQRWYASHTITLITNFPNQRQIQQTLAACADAVPAKGRKSYQKHEIPALTQQQKPLFGYAKFSEVINRLIRLYSELNLPIYTRASPWTPPASIAPLFHDTKISTPPCDILGADPVRATLAEKWTNQPHHGLRNLPPLPRYLGGQWSAFRNQELTVNTTNDWYLALSYHAVDSQMLSNLIMDSRFWLPRTAGECYTQGIARHDEQIILFGVNDKQVEHRHHYADWILQQLSG